MVSTMPYLVRQQKLEGVLSLQKESVALGVGISAKIALRSKVHMRSNSLAETHTEVHRRLLYQASSLSILMGLSSGAVRKNVPFNPPQTKLSSFSIDT